MKTLESFIGSHINTAIISAIGTANELNEQCQFEFNGVTVVVDGSSSNYLIHRDWSRGMRGYLGKNPTVGPFPKQELSPEELDSDATIEAQNERRRIEQNALHEKQQRERSLVLQGALGNTGPIELSDPEKWQSFVDSNTDPYGGRCVRYAEEWARLMQVRLESGESIVECADELSHMADDDGITGFMYGAAVSMLAACWKHGEDLRRWHNTKTQIHDEGDKANESGGVLKWGLLSIG